MWAHYFIEQAHMLKIHRSASPRCHFSSKKDQLHSHMSLTRLLAIVSHQGYPHISQAWESANGGGKCHQAVANLQQPCRVFKARNVQNWVCCCLPLNERPWNTSNVSHPNTYRGQPYLASEICRGGSSWGYPGQGSGIQSIYGIHVPFARNSPSPLPSRYWWVWDRGAQLWHACFLHQHPREFPMQVPDWMAGWRPQVQRWVGRTREKEAVSDSVHCFTWAFSHVLNNAVSVHFQCTSVIVSDWILPFSL